MPTTAHRRVVPLALALLIPAAARAQRSVHPVPPPEVRAIRRDAPVRLDGLLNDPDWQRAPAAGGFRQQIPHEGQPGERTEVRFLYDDDALYVGARMYDSLGAAGVRTRLVRRDADFESDYLEVIFDTFHDHLGRAFFAVNPSGVKQDQIGPGGVCCDDSWDPVWEVATNIDSLGWTAEMRIPFSQLSFPTDSVQTWGLQMWRFVQRDNETSMWAFWSLKEQGGATQFGHLKDLRIAHRPERAEVLPYVVGQSTNLAGTDPADPFHQPHEQRARVGADVKYLLTNNLTLDATVNPDFGQVEVDPAVVNLSAFETFFQEKRPFFVANSGLFSFGNFNCHFCSNVSSLSMFYSRRIGRAPQGASLAYNQGTYADVPDNTTILGAAKITGRTQGGTSVGILDAVTRREMAQVDNPGTPVFSTQVEPSTNYFVSRVKHDFKGGDLVLGGIATSVDRNLNDPALADRLNRHAQGLGLDAQYWWGGHTYRFMAQVAGSQIVGDTAAMLRAQTSSARYFQRPDRNGGGNGLFTNAYDPTLTRMRGFGGYARVAKEQGNWLWEAATNFRSPGFEVNDIAFLNKADYIWVNGNIVRAFFTPGSWYRSMYFIAGAQQESNFEGDVTARQLHAFAQYQALNFWNFSVFYIHRPTTLDDRATRGGPVVQNPGVDFQSANVSSDSRHAVVVSVNGDHFSTPDGASGYDLSTSVRFKPASNVSLSVGPSYSKAPDTQQYVTTVADPTATAFFGNRYVFSDIDQRLLSMETRLNVTLSTTLSLELFVQPLVASGHYSRFKEFTQPRTLAKSVYGVDQGTISQAADGSYTVDPDGAGPAAAFTFGNPDFNFRSLRGNAVLRWEYRPGSTIFLVWTQSRSDVTADGDFQFSRDVRGLFDAHPDNIFLVKINYWLGL